MLLNEFIKEHKAFLQEQRKVQEQEAAIAQLRKEMETVVTRLEEKDNKYAYSTEQHTKLKRNQRTKIKGEK
jgi:septal ring factor EnvC (AmiA/AmiB activator)